MTLFRFPGPLLYTDVQRENKIRDIKGQVVVWRLPVYEVTRDGKEYRIQTQNNIQIGPFGSDLMGAFVFLTPRDDEERKHIESLKTDDLLTFKGRIQGISMRLFVEIRPATLFREPAPSRADQAEPPSTTSSKGTTPPASAASTSDQDDTALFLADCRDFRQRVGVELGGMSKDEAALNATNICQEEVKEFRACVQKGSPLIDCAEEASPTGEGDLPRWARLRQRSAQNTKPQAALKRDEPAAKVQAEVRTSQAGTSAPAAAPAVSPPSSPAACADVPDCYKATLLAMSKNDVDSVRRIAERIDSFEKPARGNRSVARKMNDEGLRAMKQNDFTGAAAVFAKAQEEDPSDVEIASNLGLARVRAGDTAGAGRALGDALRLNPRRTSTWIGLAELAARREQNPNVAIIALLVAYEWSTAREKAIEYYIAQANAEPNPQLKAAYEQALIRLREKQTKQ